MLSEIELRAIAQDIVNKAKASAQVDQGTLKRSIRYTIRRGQVEFKQMFYGIFEDKKKVKNSYLEKIAKQYMPTGVPYKIILIDSFGGVYETGKTTQGRATQKKAVAIAKRNSTEKIKELIKKVQENASKAKLNGEEEN